MNNFRIETFGSTEYKFGEIIIRTRYETIKFLRLHNIERKYKAVLTNLWKQVAPRASLLNLRLPVLLQLEYTYRCTLNCKYCCAASSPKRREIMDFDKFKHIIDLINAEDIFQVHVLGGEPFLMPNYIRYLLENLHNKSVYISTNGTIINEKVIEWISNSKNNVEIIVGIDGHTAYIHNAVRGGFNKTCKTLTLLRNNGIPVHATTCITSYNYNRLGELVIFLIESNVSSVQFLPVGVAHLDKKIADELDTRNFKEYIARSLRTILSKYNDKITINISFSLPDFRRSEKNGNAIGYGPCMAGVTKCAINPMCEMTPCPAIRNAPKVKVSSSIEQSYYHLKEELRKRSVVAIHNKKELRTPVLCEFFGFGSCYKVS